MLIEQNGTIEARKLLGSPDYRLWQQRLSDIQEYVSLNKQRNDVLEEVAKEFEKMKAFEKDTMASFAAYVRGMKR